VTIFGQSAGGASVHYHLLSPMSKGNGGRPWMNIFGELYLLTAAQRLCRPACPFHDKIIIIFSSSYDRDQVCKSHRLRAVE
jgi:hypothetical protein